MIKRSSNPLQYLLERHRRDLWFKLEVSRNILIIQSPLRILRIRWPSIELGFSGWFTSSLPFSVHIDDVSSSFSLDMTNLSTFYFPFMALSEAFP